jgi:hypothetical protein
MTTAIVSFVLSGFIATTVYAEPPVVLFDHGHNQRFLADKEGPLQLTGLAAEFRQQGFSIVTHDSQLTAESLAGADVLVISGPFGSYTPAELDAVTSFIEHGGRLTVMLHIASPLIPLLDRLGVVASGSVLHEQENIIKSDDINFRVTRLEDERLAAGVGHFSLYGGWALLNERNGTTVAARTGDKAWIDLDGDKKLSARDAVQSFAVIVTGSVGKGRFVVFGDDAIFQNQYLDEYNGKLAANLATWLK